MLTRKQLLTTGTTLALTATLGGLGAGAANAAPSTPNTSIGAVAQHDSTPQTQRFTDVPDNLMFSTEINWLKDAGISNGWADGTYRPHQATQRAAAIAFLYRLHGSPDVQLPTQSPFKDVTPDNPFYKEIIWAHNVGITTGWSDGTFRTRLPRSPRRIPLPRRRLPSSRPNLRQPIQRRHKLPLQRRNRLDGTKPHQHRLA